MTTIQLSDGTRVQISPAELQKAADTSQWLNLNAKIPPKAQVLLEQYSGLAPEEVAPHVLDMQKRAFDTWPYPCIGHLRFLDFTTSTHPKYADLVNRLKGGQTFLDAGCCLGQDLRQLMIDGVPSSTALYGIDVKSAFFDLGYELFRDREKMHATFITSDLTRSSALEVESLTETIDAISAQSLFHLFTLQDQKTIAKHLVRMAKPVSGSMIMGRQIGNEVGEVMQGLAEGTSAYIHGPETWKQFWEEVGATTGTEWQVQTWVEEAPDRVKKQKYYKPSMNILSFAVLRA